MDEKLESIRSEGNSLFRSGNLSEAIKIYQGGLKMMEGKKLDAKLTDMKSVFYSNQAACHMKTNNPKEAVHLCNEAIKCKPLWEKPFTRRAECFKQIEASFNEEDPEATADRIRATSIVTSSPKSYKKVNDSQKVFDNIKSALLDADRNEIIFVEPGTYDILPNEGTSGEFDWSATGVSLIGANIAKTVINGVLPWESTVRGLVKRLSFAGTIVNNNYNLAIVDVLFKPAEWIKKRTGILSQDLTELFHSTMPYLMIRYNAKVTMSYCFLQGDNSSTLGIKCQDLATLVMSNCWLDGHYRGIQVNNSTCIMQNCVISNCLLYGYQQDPRGDINKPPPELSPKEVGKEIEARLKAVGLNGKDETKNELIGCYFVDNNKRIKLAYGREASNRPFREYVFSVGFSHAESIMENCYVRWTDPPCPISLDSHLVENYFINGVRHQGKEGLGRIKSCIFENFSYSPNHLSPGMGSAGLVIHTLPGFQVTNNKFSKCNIGISLDSATTSILRGNVLSDCSQGISVSKSSKPEVISNTMVRCSLGAVAFQSGGAGHFAKNTLKECGGGFVIQDECFPTLEHNMYVNCVEQPMLGPADQESCLGIYYAAKTHREAEQVKKLSGKEMKPLDHKFICGAAKENLFTRSVDQEQTKKFRICRTCAVTSTDVMTCKGCKMAAYCSETCQINDWDNHGKDCNFTFNKKKNKKTNEGHKPQKESQDKEKPKMRKFADDATF